MKCLLGGRQTGWLAGWLITSISCRVSLGTVRPLARLHAQTDKIVPLILLASKLIRLAQMK